MRAERETTKDAFVRHPFVLTSASAGMRFQELDVPIHPALEERAAAGVATAPSASKWSSVTEEATASG
jgi:hypothetical protein